MFRQIARLVVPSSGDQQKSKDQQKVETLFQQHPADLVTLMERVWQEQRRRTGTVRGSSPLFGVADVGGELSWPTSLPYQPREHLLPTRGRLDIVWDHLIYAFLVENTRVYEIFHRVLREFTHGERLGIPTSPETIQWLRTTEELFYKDGAPLTVLSLTSNIRPDIRATRRGAYYRMFGMDLSHGAEGGGRAYPYEKPAAANRGFIETFEEFLRAVWLGIAYTPEGGTTVTGPIPVDKAAIANLALRLQTMLVERRGSEHRSNLARDEFVHVSTMSWFDITLMFDTPVVKDLQATAASSEERLRRIGERVGLPAHSRSHSYFILAPLVSQLLIEIEAGLYSDPARSAALYAPGMPPDISVRDRMMKIIHHWSLVTGRDLKAAAVAPSTRAPAMPAPPAMVTPGPTAAAVIPAVPPASAGTAPLPAAPSHDAGGALASTASLV